MSAELGAYIAAAARAAAARAGVEQECRACASRNPGAHLMCECTEPCDSAHCVSGNAARRDMPGCLRAVYGVPRFAS